MKRNTDVAHWPVHLHSIFATIGAAMAGKRLHPDVLRRTDVTATVPDHRVAVRHRNEPSPRGNYYVIDVNGPRIAGQWTFRSGELETLAREAYGRDGDS